MNMPQADRNHDMTRKVLLAALLIIATASGCASSDTDDNDDRAVLRIKGSDTMLLLTLRWAEDFMRIHSRVAVYAEGGGTETGIDALIDGRADLCAASRPLRAEEVRRLLQKRGSLGISILTAKDALSIYLHPDNPISNLTMEEISDLFTGRVRNWKDVGGENFPVTVISRQPNSGTYLFFEEHVLRGKSYREDAITAASTEAVIRHVRNNRGAIGYGGLPYGDDVLHVSVDGVRPIAEHVRNGSYPISRYLYLFAAGPLQGRVKAFVDWVLSNAGQQVAGEVGYIPLWDVEQ
jgi:phosphate transport system substrate-binding protein